MKMGLNLNLFQAEIKTQGKLQPHPQCIQIMASFKRELKRGLDRETIQTM